MFNKAYVHTYLIKYVIRLVTLLLRYTVLKLPRYLGTYKPPPPFHFFFFFIK